MGELLCGGAFEPVLLVCQRPGRKEDSAAFDAGAEAEGLRLARGGVGHGSIANSGRKPNQQDRPRKPGHEASRKGSGCKFPGPTRRRWKPRHHSKPAKRHRSTRQDLTAVEVLAFLNDVEQVRKSSIGTRNCRLSALHSFVRFLADREPLAVAQCAAVLTIPTKQAPVAEIRDFDEDEISAILAQPNRLKLEGQRDHLLLAVLYNTGARIQEALDLSPKPKPFVWNRPSRFACSVKGKRSESAHSGPRLSTC